MHDREGEKVRKLGNRAGSAIALAMLGAARRGTKASSPSVADTRDAMVSSVSEAIQGARKRASVQGFRSLSAMTGEDVAADGSFAATRAEAESLADQWVDRVLVVQGGDFEEAARDIAWAAERTGTTETFREFNEAIREGCDRLEERGFRYVREWNSALELNTCPICETLHGERVETGEEFPYGDPPIHVHCACWCTVEIDDRPEEKDE